MTDDLVERLREAAHLDLYGVHRDVEREAADRIEKLEEVLDMLLVEAEDIFVCMADATGIDRHQYPMVFQIARNELNRGGAQK